MVPADSLVAFVIAAAVIIVVPGPGVLFIIGRSLALGRVGGLVSVLGGALGQVPLVVLVAFGVGTIVASSPPLFLAVRIAGSAYLVYLGVQAIRHRRRQASTDAATLPPASRWRQLGEGFVVGVTNPKTIAFFVAVLPQFVAPAAGSVQLQLHRSRRRRDELRQYGDEEGDGLGVRDADDEALAELPPPRRGREGRGIRRRLPPPMTDRLHAEVDEVGGARDAHREEQRRRRGHDRSHAERDEDDERNLAERAAEHAHEAADATERERASDDEQHPGARHHDDDGRRDDERHEAVGGNHPHSVMAAASARRPTLEP
ncbi:hypothetical protein CJ026_026430 [Ralstonia pickettii]|nr:hypothetical protein CJ026_026430 [Ralstonia pickettii]